MVVYPTTGPARPAGAWEYPKRTLLNVCFSYSDMQIRYGPELPPTGGSRPSPFFASPMTDVRKGFRMNLYHALIADGGRYVGVASFHSPPTHCRKTKGGVGVRKRTLPVSLRHPLLTPRLLDRYAPLCPRRPRVVGVS